MDATGTSPSTNAVNELPLDWTRVQRRRRKKRRKDDDDEDDDDEENCYCDDPLTCRRNLSKSRRSMFREVRAETNTVAAANHPVEGWAIFCLHHQDPQWFQGYFFPNGYSHNKNQQNNSLDDDDMVLTFNKDNKKPWGILAVQQEIDECLACQDGGYRRLKLSIYHNKSQQQQSNIGNDTNHINTDKSKKPWTISDVDWTGGDMIQLSNGQVQMDAERLWTGKKATPHLEKYFRGLISKLRRQCQIDEGVPMLEFLPDIAVVFGSMSISTPPQN